MADLAVTDLTVEYDSGGYPIRPLNRLCVTATDGELVVLLGPSGCGKTTLAVLPRRAAHADRGEHPAGRHGVVELGPRS